MTPIAAFLRSLAAKVSGAKRLRSGIVVAAALASFAFGLTTAAPAFVPSAAADDQTESYRVRVAPFSESYQHRVAPFSESYRVRVAPFSESYRVRVAPFSESYRVRVAPFSESYRVRVAPFSESYRVRVAPFSESYTYQPPCKAYQTP